MPSDSSAVCRWIITSGTGRRLLTHPRRNDPDAPLAVPHPTAKGHIAHISPTSSSSFHSAALNSSSNLSQRRPSAAPSFAPGSSRRSFRSALAGSSRCRFHFVFSAATLWWRKSARLRMRLRGWRVKGHTTAPGSHLSHPPRLVAVEAEEFGVAVAAEEAEVSRSQYLARRRLQQQQHVVTAPSGQPGHPLPQPDDIRDSVKRCTASGGKKCGSGAHGGEQLRLRPLRRHASASSSSSMAAVRLERAVGLRGVDHGCLVLRSERGMCHREALTCSSAAASRRRAGSTSSQKERKGNTARLSTAAGQEAHEDRWTTPHRMRR